ncbi:glycerol dehydratase reactivase beta/small subunit family protein [Haloarcula sp. Atlit-7R]|uniref:glycerol dehydratase reactivase beta/small subunit family protein n=1 Tax=Haloarcula sp. Atlit-7R TaxID=2282125 RepID=UPI000EF13155|nr:glycerol dehydratase reactivase beta/small subunit family protein [Haloarcula sp. Atlit-7R]RLM97250.1 glycerol dehydratase reactivation factor [Haloarcula sp. Atlit-7R]
MSGCRGPVDQNDQIPRVFVWCIGEELPDPVGYIEYGLEEEGVSWAVQSGFDGDGVPVAYDASVSSPLKIGVSVTPDRRIVVHHRQLPDDDPMFDIPHVTTETARKLGSNAARLAKGTPLKTVA